MNTICADLQETIYTECSLSIHCVCKYAHSFSTSTHVRSVFQSWRMLGDMKRRFRTRRRCSRSREDTFDERFKVYVMPLHIQVYAQAPGMIFVMPWGKGVRMKRYYNS